MINAYLKDIYKQNSWQDTGWEPVLQSRGCVTQPPLVVPEPVTQPPLVVPKGITTTKTDL
jgi:hypothetical protein